MSTFYGMIQGNRGEATRGGSKASGFRASAQSYDGSVVVDLDYDKNDKLNVNLRLCSGSTSSGWYGKLAEFDGTFEELVKVLQAYQKKKEKTRARAGN